MSLPRRRLTMLSPLSQVGGWRPPRASPSCVSPGPQDPRKSRGPAGPWLRPRLPQVCQGQRQGEGRWPRDAGRSHRSRRSSWPGLALPGHPARTPSRDWTFPSQWPGGWWLLQEGQEQVGGTPHPRLQHGLWGPLRVWGERVPRLGSAPSSTWGSQAGRLSPPWGPGAMPRPCRTGPRQVFRPGASSEAALSPTCCSCHSIPVT